MAEQVWLYQQTEPSLWTVGYYAPDGKWVPESDHGNNDDAAARCRWLNGGTDDTTPAPPSDTEDATFGEWAIVELMGHRRLAGYLTEQEIAGKGFLRLDIPGDEQHSAATQLYNPGSVYAITPTTEEIARGLAASVRPRPVERWELPRELPAAREDAEDADYDEGPF